MKKISIFTFINILFSFTFILFCTSLFFYTKANQAKYNQTQTQRYQLIANNFITQFENNDQNLSFENIAYKLHLEKITNTKQKLKILNDGYIIYQKEYKYTRLRIFTLNHKRYIYIQNLGLNLMYKDKSWVQYDFTPILIVALFIFVVILILYILLLQKLKPLKTLNDNMISFSQGNLDIKIDLQSADEIGVIAKNFNQAIQNINYLINSKNLFMRNIMHELKTPITKGLFLVDMIQTSSLEDKKELKNILFEMDNILKQLSNIEKYQTQFLNIKKESIDIQDILTQYDNLTLNTIAPLQIVANKELFSIVIKNLIENGYKYAQDKHILVNITHNSISFHTKGIPLTKELSYYTQPFTQETKNSQGFGLGLYIVNEILKLHNFTLEYKYQKPYNIFSILIHSSEIQKSRIDKITNIKQK